MPINVTENDHENEARCAKLFVDNMPSVASLDVSGFQTNLVSMIDGMITLNDGRNVFAEIRCRERYSLDQLERWGPYINMHKLWNIIHESRSRGISSVFLVFAKDGFLVYNLYNSSRDTALDGSNKVAYGNPERREKRGQDVNDSCFAAYLWNPIKTVRY
jgi:hypothetical protein